MGITTKKLYELFEYAWLMMRQNPGGTSPVLQGSLLGFAGTIDIREALNASSKGEVKIKSLNGAVQRQMVDFSGTNPAELTPSAAAAALEAAGFADCRFSVDTGANRLRLEPVGNAPLRIIQIYGDLAAALNFGGCRSGEGKGCYVWASLDGDLKSAAETEQWDEDKNIENESPLGAKVTYTISGRRGKTQVVLTDRLSSREAKQMINGGRWISGDAETPEEYEPPVASDSGDARRVDIFTISPILDKNDSTEGDAAFYRVRQYIGGVGHSNRSGGAGSFTDSEYTLTFGSYTGEDGKEHASPLEADFTPAQWEALELKGFVELDWANA